MRLTYIPIIACAGLMALCPALGWAKTWQGITPGSTGAGEVVQKYGEPSTAGNKGGKKILVYRGDKAISGTKQVQFTVSTAGTVEEITVFPTAPLDKEAVEGTYGKDARKTFTDDFIPVWHYKNQGIIVYFNKDGIVEAIVFKPGVDPPAAPRPVARDGE